MAHYLSPSDGKACEGPKRRVLLLRARLLPDVLREQEAKVGIHPPQLNSNSFKSVLKRKHSVHIRTKHKPRTPCAADCGQLFPDKKHMLRHVRSAHKQFLANPMTSIAPPKFYCPDSNCKAPFTRQDNLKRHIKEVHMGKRQRR